MMGELIAFGKEFGVGWLFIFVILYMVYRVYRDLRKDIKDKIKTIEFRDVMTNMNKKQTEILEHLTKIGNINKTLLSYLEIVSRQYTEESTQAQVEIVINSLNDNTKEKIYGYVSEVRQKNDIFNHERETKAKIKDFIHNQYLFNSLILNEFKYKGKKLSDYLGKNIDRRINSFGDKIIEIIFTSPHPENCEVTNKSCINRDKRVLKTLKGFLNNTLDISKNKIIVKIKNG